MFCDALLREFTEMSRNVFGENLLGIYLHGSLAMNCFNPQKSDIDLILVVRDTVSFDDKLRFTNELLALEDAAPEKGFELSIVKKEFCQPFTYPTPFEYHFSHGHKAAFLADTPAYIEKMQGVDKDLGAHFTIINHFGIPLYGPPVREVFAPVPKKDYFDSIWYDVEHAKEDILDSPMYIVLNLCRVLGYARDGLVLSKKTGGEWGVKHLPATFRGLVEAALGSYTSDAEMVAVAEIVPVVAGIVPEAAAVFVVLIGAGVQGMQVPHGVAGGLEHHTYLNPGDSHVGESVVVSLHKNADGVDSTVADDVHIHDVAVGGAGVCTVLDVQADLHVLDGNVADFGFTAAVDGDALGDAAAVHDTAGEGVVGADGVNVVCGMDRAQTYHGFVAVPGFRRLENGIVGQSQIHALFRMGGGADGLGEQIHAVGEVDGAVGIVVDDLLDGIGQILRAVGGHIVGHNHVTQSGCFSHGSTSVENYLCVIAILTQDLCDVKGIFVHDIGKLTGVQLGVEERNSLLNGIATKRLLCLAAGYATIQSQDTAVPESNR